MELSYRGVTYSKQNAQVETLVSDRTGRFLGQTYPLRRPVETWKPKMSSQKYRGIAYGH